MYITTSITHINKRGAYVVNKGDRNENRVDVHLRNLKQRQSVCCGVGRTGVPKCHVAENSVVHIRSD